MSSAMFPFILLATIHLFCPVAADSEDVIRIEEKLTTDREFYDHWMQLISLQADQLEEQSLDFPLSYASLNSCTRVPPTEAEDYSDTLRPSSIAVYADMGHLTTYCSSNFSMLQAGILDSCEHRSSSMELPSLDKMLRVFNPNLVVVQSNERDDGLVDQARSIAQSIQQIEGYENSWKLIVIAATIQDGEASETRQTAVEVLGAIEELHKLLPIRTFIAVIRSSGNGIWVDASHSHNACHDMLSRWKSHSQFNSNSVWDQVEIIVQKNFRKLNFTVEVLPLLRESALTNLPEQMDLSVLGYDCSHFSERGLSILHMAVWNSLFTKSGDRVRQYRPSPPQLLCPDFRCPFFRTVSNSGYCIYNAAEDTEPSIYPKLITVCVLLLCLLLAAIVLFFMCRKPRRTEDIKKPVKAFGASFSSIKFIDEDIV
ncbi:hypothetical protein ANCCAN_13183 [Ancylostoma caninum]|uniref:Phospholipase B1, membrane-associated n=1 Tax=Ancylostoma caninum TaxID=29170 RepID=A0A368G903_ANCCA|nr:hypothetical protein ANCCAN_13183 [Ancylostoma caninum]